jgi:hypothetical protein
VKVGWGPLFVVCAAAVVRAITAHAPDRPPPASEAARRQIFRHIASDESAERREAAKKFPTDRWSRDDDFHEKERTRARDWAGSHDMWMGDALSAVDEGIRARWPHGNPVALVVTVPPCRPRAVY